MPSNESERLKALRQYKILDTQPEQAFDDLALIASHICETPIALITLVDEDRQWFKSRIGIDVQETARSISFCSHAIEQKGVFTVPDATLDPRFRDNPVVKGEPHIRFYAGAPLASRDGYALGTLCVIDYVPRTLTPEQKNALTALERQVAAQLELRRNLEELRVALEGIENLSAMIPYCSTCQMNIVIPADPEDMKKISAGVVELLNNKRWTQSEIADVQLALDEALINAIRYGCNNDRSKHVQCCVTFDDSGELVVVIKDPGPGFDVKAVPNPLEGEGLFRGSGRGVFLINKLMDTVEYADQGSKVLMRKRPEASLSPSQ
ncbi:putative anti-sigma regulatory factor, serine/threonine protein kinase [Candidatus Koribacter versatilis Ellin345]|uniref:Anti-sigma regulatory factor, serine/threonine protein kinase n=1 Tax=Koribacter versatilis (strain Ellin345) TaxID=204669 RepID=Q1IMB4_KORVE|nr:ATP-binding protein [Candidatus Koribacter versatilis]ABF41986.1 putative anti-sigma regulatory factor, serine/threonine protein kinase [Candidatus Koribacter versatilis Ellin345]